MAVDADGAAVLVCRYVAPTLLPPSLAVNVAAGGAAVAAGGVEMLMLKLARFVAHVSAVRVYACVPYACGRVEVVTDTCTHTPRTQLGHARYSRVALRHATPCLPGSLGWGKCPCSLTFLAPALLQPPY